MRFSPRVSPRAGGTGAPVGACGAASPVAAAGGSDRALVTLLRDLGPRLRRGPAPPDEPVARDSVGLPAVDRLLGGGVPRGRLVEVAGPSSSGRTALALGWLARLTRAGELVAVVDPADALDPRSAAEAGVLLPRVLWVRAPGLPEALRATERLLAARGFALVLLDLGAADAEATSGADAHATRGDDVHATRDADAEARPATNADSRPGRAGAAHADLRDTTWLRLARAAAGARTSLALLTAQRRAGSFADLALELRPGGARFSPAPALLEGLETRAVLVRNRLGPSGQESPWVLSA